MPTRVPPRRALALEPLEPRTLLAGNPIGNIDAFVRTLGQGVHVAGWAVNPDNYSSPVNVEITVNGNKSTIPADYYRSDLSAPFGSPSHGFDFYLNVPTGDATVSVVAVSALDERTTLKVGTLVTPQPVLGNVDVFTNTRIAGWIANPDKRQEVHGGLTALNPLAVRVVVNGVAMPDTLTNISRPDVGQVFNAYIANVGFDIAGDFTNKAVEVYGLDTPSNQPYLIYTSNRAPIGRVDLLNSSTLAGWAIDTDSLNAASTLKISVDGNPFATATANLSRPDLVPYFNSANHGFSVDLSSLSAGSHWIHVTALDNQTSAQNEIFNSLLNNTPPTGNVDLIDGSKIYGWAYDADAPAAALTIYIYVDGSSAGTATANLARTDVDTYLNSPNHAFAADLPALSFGDHTIALYAAESIGNFSTFIGAQKVTNHPPVGVVDLVNDRTIAGWARDPDRPTESVDVRVYVNFLLVPQVTANLARPDVANVFNQSFNALGFSIGFVTQPGANEIDLFALDKSNNTFTLLLTTTINA